VGAELFHADRRDDGRTDGQTDMTKLIVAFRNFADTSKNQLISQTKRQIYEGHLESKERLHIQPAHLLHCTRSGVLCVQ
jgi:hypothetical protein